MYDDQQRLVRWNKKQEEVLGYSDEELKHIHTTDLIVEEDKDLVKSVVEQVLTKGEIGEVEASLMLKNGKKIPFYFSAARIILEEKPHLVGLALDISELKEAEKALKSCLAKVPFIKIEEVQQQSVHREVTTQYVLLGRAIGH